MLRRSTSFETRPMPMNTAMNRPNIEVADEAEVLDDLDVLPRRELADQVRRAHQQDREQHQVVEHLVAHRFAEHVDGDRARWPSRRAPARRLEAAARAQHVGRGDLLDEEVLERVADRVERHEVRARRR